MELPTAGPYGTARMDRAVIDLLTYYQRELRESPDGRAALEGLKITRADTVEHFKLGYCSGRACKLASDAQRGLLEDMRLAFRGHERFTRCIVVPVYDADDRLVDLCGLRQYPSGLRVITWQEPLRGLIGVAALRVYPEIALTENPFQALHVRQHGYPNVIGLRNAAELRSQIPTLEQHDIRRAYVVARKGRRILTGQLEAAGIEVVPISFPNDRIVVPKESLAVVAETSGESAAPTDVKLVARTDTTLHFTAGDVSWKLESIAASGLGMRCQVRAERDGVSFIDRLDLASSAARRKLARAAATRLGVTSRVLETQAAGIAAAIDALGDEPDPAAAPAVFTDEQTSAALKALQNDDVLALQSDAIERLFDFAAEEENKRLALLVAASRLLDRPLGAIVRGAAGSGKSSLMQAVGRLLPCDAVLNLSRLTPQALYFLPRDALEHKLLVCDEYEGLASSEYALRTMMSSQSLNLAIAVREGGRVPQTRTIEIPAHVAILVSTTQPVDMENLSRFIELRLDATSRQTRRVMEALASARGKKQDHSQRQDELAHVQAMNAQLRRCTVELPFADKLVYSSGSVLARRQFAQIVGLVSAHAALLQFQRKTHEEPQGSLIVEATWDDYRAVHPLLSHVVEHFEEEISPAAAEFLEHLEAREAKQFTRKDVMEWLEWSYSKAYRTLAELTGLDLLVPDRTANGVLRTYEAAPYFRIGRGISQIVPPGAG